MWQRLAATTCHGLHGASLPETLDRFNRPVWRTSRWLVFSSPPTHPTRRPRGNHQKPGLSIAKSMVFVYENHCFVHGFKGPQARYYMVLVGEVFYGVLLFLPLNQDTRALFSTPFRRGIGDGEPRLPAAGSDAARDPRRIRAGSEPSTGGHWRRSLLDLRSGPPRFRGFLETPRVQGRPSGF